MSKLTELLQSPYPTLCQRWKTVLISPLIVFLILYLLQPFGISQMTGANKVLLLLGYGVVSAIALSIAVYLLPVLFPSYYKEQAWMVWKNLLNIVLMCFLITVGNWLYTSWIYEQTLNWQLFCICLLWMALLSPFPIVIFTMWNRNLQLARNLREATEMNFYLSKKISQEDRDYSQEEKEFGPDVLVFSGGTREMLEMKAAQFLYAEAEGNYVEVNYLSTGDGKVAKKLLRLTMKQAEEAVEACSFIIRCHRAFLVNIGAVVKVDGNSQGYRLLLEGCESEVPVSRAYAKGVKMRIEDK